MLFECRSYALALWLMQKGHAPIEGGFTPGGSLVFTFPPAASKDVGAFHEAKTILNDMEARARALQMARQHGGNR